MREVARHNHIPWIANNVKARQFDTTHKKVICVRITPEVEGKALPIEDDVALETCCTIVPTYRELSDDAYLFDNRAYPQRSAFVVAKICEHSLIPPFPGVLLR